MAFLVFVGVVIGLVLLARHIAASPDTARTQRAPRAISATPMTFSIRLQTGTLDPMDPGSSEVHRVMAAGPFPLEWNTYVEFVTSVFDITDGHPAPVLSVLEAFQESDGIVFQHRLQAGELIAGNQFSGWVCVGLIPPILLQPPRSGVRQLLAVTRMLDADAAPLIENGNIDDDEFGLLWQGGVRFTHVYDAKGYVELVEDREETAALAIKIGVAVALADGTLHDGEGSEIRRWAERSLNHLSGEFRVEQKNRLNLAMREAFAAAQAHELSLPLLLARMNQIGENAIKYETLDLCFDIMAADGVAKSEEMRRLDEIARGLDLNPKEVDALRDKKLLGLDSGMSSQSNAEQMLGIDPSWDSDRVRRHLKDEFRKWNNRLSTLDAGAEREMAQRILDAIATIRKRHE